MPEGRWVGLARFGLPGLLLGLGLSWWGGREAPAQGPPVAGADRGKSAAAPAEANGMIAFTTPAPGSAQLLYLVDTRARSFAIYRVDLANPKGIVKLEAARQYNWDLKLTDYNNQPPEVGAIESTVKTLGRPNP